VESAQDILEEFPRLSALLSPLQDEMKRQDVEHPLLTAMGYDPVSVEALAERAGMDAASLTAQLLILELDGLIERLPGEVYRRLH
jgi:DNA processing protein